MGGDPLAVGPAWGKDHPARYRQRIESTLSPNPPSQSHLAIEGAEQLVDVCDVGLQLDYQQRPTLRVPGEHVDHAAFAKDRERDLWIQAPVRVSGSKSSGEKLVKARVAGVDKTVEIASPPSSDEVDAHIELSGDPSNCTQAQRVVMAAL